MNSQDQRLTPFSFVKIPLKCNAEEILFRNKRSEFQFCKQICFHQALRFQYKMNALYKHLSNKNSLEKKPRVTFYLDFDNP